MMICEWYEILQNDKEVNALVLRYDCVMAYYKPTFSRRRRRVKDSGTKAFEHFWSSSGRGELKYMLERKYGLNVCSNKELSAVKIAVSMLIDKLRDDAGIKDPKL